LCCFLNFLGRKAGKGPEAVAYKSIEVDQGKDRKKMKPGKLVVKTPGPVGRALKAVGSKNRRKRTGKGSKAEKNKRRRQNLQARKQQKREGPKATQSVV
jgi:hypothetical protein